MYELTILPVHRENQELFSDFAIPQNILESWHAISSENKLAIILSSEQQNIGIGLAHFTPFLSHLNILYISIKPLFQHQYLENQILSKIEEEGQKLGLKIFTFAYSQQDKHLFSIEKMLASCRWANKRPFMTRCRYDMHTLHIPWLHNYAYSFPKDFKAFCWKELTEKDELIIQKKEQQHLFDNIVSPFRDKESLANNSLGLRYKGEVVGWILTHVVNHIQEDKIIRYSSMYIDQSLKHHGLLMVKLLSESINRHYSLREKYPTALFEVPLLYTQKSWNQFVERRLVPYADDVERLVQAWKVIE